MQAFAIANCTYCCENQISCCINCAGRINNSDFRYRQAAHSMSVRYGISYDLNKTSPIKGGSAFVTLRVRTPGFPYVTEGIAMEYDYCVYIDMSEFFKLTPCV